MSSKARVACDLLLVFHCNFCAYLLSFSSYNDLLFFFAVLATQVSFEALAMQAWGVSM